MIQSKGPLHGYEIKWLMEGNILVRQSRKYPFIVMWLTRNSMESA